MVLDVNPVTDIPPIAVEWQWLVSERVGDKKRDEFLDVLVRAEVVCATRDDDWQSIRACQQIGAGLAGRVRIGGTQRGVFGGPAGRDAAVDFVGGNLDELLHAELPGRFEQRVGTEHIGLDEIIRPE